MFCNSLGMLVRALELEWDVLSEEIGFWLPAEVTNEEHDDKPEGEEEPGNISQKNSRFLISAFAVIWVENVC